MPARGAPVPDRRPIPRRPAERPVVEAPPPEEEEEEVDGEVLQKIEAIGYPESIGEWCNIQEEIWGDAPPLRQGWIRIWSRSQKSEYYMRVEDQYSTFDVAEAKK